LHPGRRIWFIVKLDTLDPYVVGPVICIKFKQFLPRGSYEKNGYLVDRKKSLIQVYTDPGGMRTLAAADIRLSDPRRTGR
jgi:hypothetical protein